MCCLAVPGVVLPQPIGPRGSWASCLSFALQLALVLLVPVGSLLPYGSHLSRWGHPCGVEARLSSIGTKVLSHHMGQVFGSVSSFVRPTVVVGAAPFLLVDGLRTSV